MGGVEMKEYFSHDYGSRNDRKITRLLMKHGMQGIGVFWCIIEMLYEEGGYLPLEYDRITFELRTENGLIESVINDFELFENDGEKFWSESILERLTLRSEKSEKARESINKRWEKYRNTNVIRTYNESNTIKVKESKVKKRKEKDEILIDSLEIKNGYSEVFLRWLKYKRSRNESYKNKDSAFLAYEKLYKLSSGDHNKAMQIIENSMANNWAGLFELKDNGKKINDYGTEGMFK
jgi:hypothetical protein